MIALSRIRARHSPQRAEHLWNGLAQNVFPSGFATAKTYQNSRGKSNSRRGHQQPDGMPPYCRSVLQLEIEIMADFVSMLPATLANDL
jgi:hypothetical protein